MLLKDRLFQLIFSDTFAAHLKELPDFGQFYLKDREVSCVFLQTVFTFNIYYEKNYFYYHWIFINSRNAFIIKPAIAF